jgi:simple sugar transport system substrate-binding protein
MLVVALVAIACAPSPSPTSVPVATSAPTPPAAAATSAPTAAPTRAATTVATTAPTAVATAQPVVFGMILVGPQNDHGWSEAQYTAGQYIEKNLPGTKMVSLDKVNPTDRKGVTFDQVVDDMVKQGAKIIFATSDDFQDDTRASAQKRPDITFIMVSGDDVLQGKNPPNLGNYMGRMEYGKQIAGCAAALSTSTGKIGYLGPLINNETRRLASSVYLGAKYCWENYLNKNANDLQFSVTWIGFWFNIPGVTLDPTKVANDFYGGGTDIVVSGIDTTEAVVVSGQQAKAGKNVFAIPYDFKGACSESPQTCLGVPYFNWGPGYLRLMKAFIGKTWKPQFIWDGPDWKDINNADTSAVGWVDGPALKPNAQTKVQQFIKGLGDGSIDLWKGPLNLQDGTAYLKAGEKATDQQIWALPQLLQGMKGASKQ